MVEVPLSKGYVAFVDDEDADRVMAHKWSASERPYGAVYAVRDLGRVLLHRFVMGLPPARVPEVDHRDGNPLNNQKANLRLATRSQNNANQRPQSRRKSSVFKGVTWSKDKNRWLAHIKVNGRRRCLGSFLDERAAAAAYDMAAPEVFGAFARVNGVLR